MSFHKRLTIMLLVSNLVALSLPLAAGAYVHKMTVTGIKQGAWNVKVEVDPDSSYNAQSTALQSTDNQGQAVTNKPRIDYGKNESGGSEPISNTMRHGPDVGTPNNGGSRMRGVPTDQTGAYGPMSGNLGQLSAAQQQQINQTMNRLIDQRVKQALAQQQQQIAMAQPGQPPVTINNNTTTGVDPGQLEAVRESIIEAMNRRDRRMIDSVRGMLQGYNVGPDAQQAMLLSMTQYLQELAQWQAQQAYQQALQQQNMQLPRNGVTPEQLNEAMQQAQANFQQTMKNELPEQVREAVAQQLGNQMNQMAQQPLNVESGINPSLDGTTSNSLKATDYARIANEAAQLASGDLSKEKHYLEVSLRCANEVISDLNSTQGAAADARQFVGTTLLEKFNSLQKRMESAGVEDQSTKQALEGDMQNCESLSSKR